MGSPPYGLLPSLSPGHDPDFLGLSLSSRFSPGYYNYCRFPFSLFARVCYIGISPASSWEPISRAWCGVGDISQGPQLSAFSRREKTDLTLRERLQTWCIFYSGQFQLDCFAAVRPRGG